MLFSARRRNAKGCEPPRESMVCWLCEQSCRRSCAASCVDASRASASLASARLSVEQQVPVASHNLVYRGEGNGRCSCVPFSLPHGRAAKQAPAATPVESKCTSNCASTGVTSRSLPTWLGVLRVEYQRRHSLLSR
eukprot:scaffold2775_cov343-Prasinococcus_capsulatus_cf.AAC.14